MNSMICMYLASMDMVKVALNTSMGSNMEKISFLMPALCSSLRMCALRARKPSASMKTTGRMALNAFMVFLLKCNPWEIIA